MAVIQVQLNDDLNNKDEFWSKFKHGINDFKAQLPKSVLGVQVMDDFGDTSALLITMESEDCASPRFQNSYAPQMGGPNFAQFIVNTTGNENTEALLDEYTPRCRGMFPEAVVRFKQLGYSEAVSPIEVRLSGDDLVLLQKEAERVTAMLRTLPELNLVRTNFNEPLAATRITLDEDQSTRMGISNAALETTLAMRYGSGIPVGTVWEGNYDIHVVMKSNRSDLADFSNLEDERIPVAGGLANIPLRQVAKIEPSWENGQIVRRNGVRTSRSWLKPNAG